MSQELINYLRLSILKGVGPVHAKKLVSYCGSIEGVFSETAANLHKIPNIGPHLIKQIKSLKLLSRAQQELAFIEKITYDGGLIRMKITLIFKSNVMMRQFCYISREILILIRPKS